MAPEVSQKPQILDLRAPTKGSNCTVLGVIPQRGGEWLAGYASLRLGGAGGATLLEVCPISDLPGPQQNRALKMKGAFSRLIEAATPAGPHN